MCELTYQCTKSMEVYEYISSQIVHSCLLSQAKTVRDNLMCGGGQSALAR